MKKLPYLLPLALSLYPATVWADAPRDIGGMRLWADGLDTNGTDDGSGNGTRPAVGSTVSTWKDKSAYGHVLTASGTALPTATSDGVSCTTTSSFVRPGGIYNDNEMVLQSDVFAIVNTRSAAASYLMYNSGPNAVRRMSIGLPYNGKIYWDHPIDRGRFILDWNLFNFPYNRKNIWNFSIYRSWSQSLTFEGWLYRERILNGGDGIFTQEPGSTFHLCGGEGLGMDGTVSEILIFSYILYSAPRKILQTYLASKYQAFYAPNLFGNFEYGYHVGGIGAESDGSLTKGTSVGLTIENSTFLAAGNYLLAGTNAVNPAKGIATTDLPSGYPARAARTWYMARTGSSTGNVKMSFDPTALGITTVVGQPYALLYREGTTGAYTVKTTGVLGADGVLTFDVSNPQNGYYTVGGLMSESGTPLPAPSIASTANVSLISDPVNGTTNPKIIPGALTDVTITATNSGNAAPDNNSSAIAVPIPAGMKLFVGDLGAANSGPVAFTPNSSGLTYTYSGLSSTTDSLDFSKDNGASWTYTPVQDADMADAIVTNLRVRPAGSFAPSSSFGVRWRLVIK